MQELIHRAIGGDRNAEEQLFGLLQRRFVILARMRLSEQDANDVACDACLTVFEKYRTIESPDKFVAWAHGVLRNKIGVYLKKLRVRNANAMYAYLGASGQDRGTTIWQPELRHALVRCVRRLIVANNRYARVLNLVHQGYSTDEICSRLGLTSNNLYVLLSRSRKALSRCLKENV